LPTLLCPRPPPHELRCNLVRPCVSSAKHLSCHRVELCVGLLRSVAVGPSSPSRMTFGATTPSSALVEWRLLATPLTARRPEPPMALLVASSTSHSPARGLLLPRPRLLTSTSVNTLDTSILPLQPPPPSSNLLVGPSVGRGAPRWRSCWCYKHLHAPAPRVSGSLLP
jgi:hypothetical protein